MAPYRRTAGAGARLAGAFLLPWLFAAASDLGAIFRMGAILARIGLHRGRHLMDEVSAPWRIKNLPGKRDGPDFFTGHRENRHLARCLLSFSLRFFLQ